MSYNPGGDIDTSISSDGVDTSDGTMNQPQYSSFSVDSQGALHLDHEVKKWVKVDGDTPHVRPTAAFSMVTFNARINAQVYDPRANNNNANGNTSRAVALLDTFPQNNNTSNSSPTNRQGAASAASSSSSQGQPIDAILGVTKLFRGLEIALRSMSVNEHADFLVPPEMGHYFGAGELPMRCPLDIDVKLLACEDFHLIPRLPTVDYEPFKVTRTAGPDPSKRIYLGSTVDFFVQRPHDRTGQMTTPKKMTVVAGTAQFDPVLDMMLMSMAEREIATFVLRHGPMDAAPSQFIITVVSVRPPAIGVNISSAHIMRVYGGEAANDFDEAEYGAPVDFGKENSNSAAVDRLQETARNVFQENPVVSAWHFAAANAIVRQRGGSIEALNKSLAQLTANMGRCAYRLKRFNESLSLARESYTFDQNFAKSAFLLAQSLRETDSLTEALTIVKQVQTMPDAHASSVAEERKVIEDLLAARDAASSASSSAQATPQKK